MTALGWRNAAQASIMLVLLLNEHVTAARVRAPRKLSFTSDKGEPSRPYADPAPHPLLRFAGCGRDFSCKSLLTVPARANPGRHDAEPHPPGATHGRPRSPRVSKKPSRSGQHSITRRASSERKLLSSFHAPASP